MNIVDFFDDKKYVSSFGDLDAAFKDGRIRSGLTHYISNGATENRLVRSDPKLKIFTETRSFPTYPPRNLMRRVHGSESTATYNLIGKFVAFDLEKTMNLAGASLPEGAAVLDFGSGPGRVAQWFKLIYPNAEIHGCDIDPDGIEWAERNLPGKFIVNNWEPPLPYDDNTFDLIYSISVFTHLPEDMQFRWLKELSRVTKPGGFLLLSVHGAQLILSQDKIVDSVDGPLEDDGFYYVRVKDTAGLPDFYQRAFHTVDYIHRTWNEFFDVRFVVKRGINDHQDLVVCRAK